MRTFDCHASSGVSLQIEQEKMTGAEVYCITARSLSEGTSKDRAGQDPVGKNRICEMVAELRIPILNICGVWHPGAGTDRILRADWSKEIKTSAAVNAPVMSLFDEQGNNRLTYAVSEISRVTYMRCGVHEENGDMLCRVRIPLEASELPYTFRIYVDETAGRMSESLQRVAAWWQQLHGLKSYAAGKTARAPMYSTWYSYHQELQANELEAECRLAQKLGFQTILLDDGWQTPEHGRGYAYCGDWEVAPEKIPDMQAHVKAVHDIGMKYMIWFSVPFIGRYSAAWKTYRDMLLYYDEERQAGVVDLRYPEVRKYLLSVYQHAVAQWDMDGLKLDFIDEFYLRTEHNEVRPGMDHEYIEDAVVSFLNEVRDSLLKLKPELMIEFRQSYTGPIMKSAGNIIRVGDCPESGISNRVGSMDIRFLSLDNAVHSDMVMWNRNEKVVDVVRQLQQCLFCTLQLSVRLEEQSEEVLRALRYWLDFMQAHEETLQRGSIMAHEPQQLYPVIEAKGAEERIVCAYSEGRVLAVLNECRTICVNATKDSRMYIMGAMPGQYQVEIRDCTGRLTEQRPVVFQKDILTFQVPESGVLQITPVIGGNQYECR